MRYRRAMLLVELGTDAGAAFTALHGVAPRLEHLVVVAWTPTPTFSWLAAEPAPGSDEIAEAVDELASAAAASFPGSRVQLVPELGSEALAGIGAAESIDLLAVASPSLRTASVLYDVRRRQQLPILFVQGEVPPGPTGEILCFAMGRRGRVSIRAFLHDHAGPSMHVRLLGPEAPAPDDLPPLVEVTGIAATVETHGATSIRQLLDEWTPSQAPRLLVIAEAPAAVLLAARLPAPALLLPPLATTRRFEPRALDVADVAELGGPLRVRLDQTAPVGDLPPLPDQEIAFVSGGRVVASARTHAGQSELPKGLRASSLGVCRIGEQEAADPVTAIEQTIAVIHPGDRPLILFDAELTDQTLHALHSLAGPPVPELLAVRLRPARSCRSIRDRLRACALPARVLDARAVLDEGDAFDVSDAADPVRLARVAAQLRQAGFPVASIVHRGPLQPLVRGFEALSEPDLLAGATTAVAKASADPVSIPGNRIELEFDNTQARRWLLEAIEGSRLTLCLQVYMAVDDDVGRPVEAALAAAGARGVKVRVLVDSLHGLHGSFGSENPILARLAGRPGVELRTSRPITEIPSLVDLKLRDHRKLVVADGRIALVGGRNLSHEYYTGFDEVRLGPQTAWREVPWLDAGARVEGPAVAAITASFREAWLDAGGTPFEIVNPPAVGTSATRVVVHHGLRDAQTLEAYRELIETARSHVYVVNGFPLMLELQHALVRAIERGLRVRTVVGHLTPTHGGQPFKGPWSTARRAATELVHARMDPIVAAGGEVHLFAIEDLPDWSPGLGAVQPHVHAKAMSVDGRRCAIGSANLDLTSAYWESELMLVVEDAEVVRGFEAQIDRLIAGSVRIRKDDPAWQSLAGRRAWMRHWPGVLSI